jgi:hypothetical protein
MQLVYSLAACVYTILVIASLCAVQLFAVPALLLNRLGFISLLRKAPYVTLFVSGGLFVWAGWRLSRDTFDSAKFVILGVIWLLFLNCFLIAATEITGDTRYRPNEIRSLLDRWPYRWIAPRMNTAVDVNFVRQLVSVALAFLFPVVAMIAVGHLAICWAIPYLLFLDSTSFSHKNIDHSDTHNNIFKIRPSRRIWEASILWTLAFGLGLA